MIRKLTHKIQLPDLYDRKFYNNLYESLIKTSQKPKQTEKDQIDWKRNLRKRRCQLNQRKLESVTALNLHLAKYCFLPLIWSVIKETGIDILLPYYMLAIWFLACTGVSATCLRPSWKQSSVIRFYASSGQKLWYQSLLSL